MSSLIKGPGRSRRDVEKSLASEFDRANAAEREVERLRAKLAKEQIEQFKAGIAAELAMEHKLRADAAEVTIEKLKAELADLRILWLPLSFRDGGPDKLAEWKKRSDAFARELQDSRDQALERANQAEAKAAELRAALEALYTFPGVRDLLAPIESLGSIAFQVEQAIASTAKP